MDISMINAAPAKTPVGLIIGEDSAPVKMYEFMNVRCPYCKKWFEDHDELLAKKVAEGQVQRIIKLFDKEKETLQPGNVMHRFVNYNDPETGLANLREMYATQNEWGGLPLEAVKEYAMEKLALKETTHEAIAQQVIDEANAASIKFVPTVLVNDHIFDENITEAELQQILAGE